MIYLVMRPDTSNLDQLRETFANRRIADGYALLTQMLHQMRKQTGDQPPATDLLLLIALWMDIGFDDGLLDELLSHFTPSFRRCMPLPGYLELRFVEAWKAMLHEDEDIAIRLLEFVLSAQEEFYDPDVSLIAHYFKARAHRKRGEYEKACEDTLEAHRRARELKLEKFVAVIQAGSMASVSEGKNKRCRSCIR